MKSKHAIRVPQDEIDWLAEGEMGLEEREELFDRLERDPSGWRRCAIALLEHHALRQTLPAARQSVEVESRLPIDSVINPNSKRYDGSSIRGIQARNRWITSLTWGIATALVFAFGFWIGNADQPMQQAITYSAGPGRLIENEISMQIAGRDPQTLIRVNNAVNRLGVSDSQLIAVIGIQGESKTEFVPVIQSATLERQLSTVPTPRLPQQYTKQLHQAGWQLNLARQFLSFHLPNGQNEVMPIDLLNYRYVGQQTF